MGRMAQLRARRHLGLGDTSWLTYAEGLAPWLVPGAVVPALALTLFPGTPANDLARNVTTGNLTPSQKAQLQAAAAQQYVTAGMDPATAQQQAASDVNASLSTTKLPGAFGITWTGAGPESPTWVDQALADVAAPLEPFAPSGDGSNSGQPSWLAQNWPWLAIGAVGLWWVTKKI